MSDDVFIDEADFNPINPDESTLSMLPADLTIKRIAAAYPNEDPKLVLIDKLEKALVRGFADMAYLEWAICEADTHWANASEFHDWLRKATWMKGGRCRISGPLLILPRFWHRFDASIDGEWAGKIGGFDSAMFANWQRAEFACAETTFFRVEFPAPAGTVTFYNVQFAQIDVDAIAPLQPNSEKPVRTGRSTKYDWTAAMVHLVGVAELDGLVSDPQAHGALADVEKRIANWFSENSTEQPSEAAIRPYARQVLDAILLRGKRAS